MSYSHFCQDLSNDLYSTAELIPDLLKDAKADTTSTKYYNGFIRWKRWAEANAIQEFLPAKYFHMVVYLISLVQQANSPSPIMTAFYSIRWEHTLIGVESPTCNPLVKNILEAAKRRLAKPVKKKEPITPELLLAMYDKIYEPGNLFKLRIIVVCLLSYAAFLRSSELIKLTKKDIYIEATHMSIFLECSKTDVYRDGSWILVARTGSKLCPFKNFEEYMGLANIQGDDSFIFQNFVQYKDHYEFRKDNKPMSYSRVLELFIHAFCDIVSDISSYGLHGLRAGGATAAANKGIPDRLFQCHGRWRSENAKDGYIKEALAHRLLVSKNLGI